jgi:hypothetical protein
MPHHVILRVAVDQQQRLALTGLPYVNGSFARVYDMVLEHLKAIRCRIHLSSSVLLVEDNQPVCIARRVRHQEGSARATSASRSGAEFLPVRTSGQRSGAPPGLD